MRYKDIGFLIPDTNVEQQHLHTIGTVKTDLEILQPGLERMLLKMYRVLAKVRLNNLRNQIKIFIFKSKITIMCFFFSLYYWQGSISSAPVIVLIRPRPFVPAKPVGDYGAFSVGFTWSLWGQMLRSLLCRIYKKMKWTKSINKQKNKLKFF